jgi:hypothetical protein
MRLIFLLVTLLFLWLPNSYSQSKFNLGGSFKVGIPVGDLSDIAKTGIGGSINSEYRFSDKISATFAVYYYSYPSKVPTIAVGGSTYDFSIDAIPVIAGVRYYIDNSFFVTGEVGAHFTRVSADVYLGENLTTDYEVKSGIGAGTGYRIYLSEASVFEITGVYQYVEDNLSSVSLRATILILMGNL